MKYLLITTFLLTCNFVYSQGVKVKIKNDSRYFINEVALKSDASRIYFQNLRPGELSEAKVISKLWDSNWITVQFVRRKWFFKQLATIHMNPIDHVGENLYEDGALTLRLNIKRKESRIIQTTEREK